jgi:hypothetical protein
LPVDDSSSVIAEKEPNDGFAKPQTIVPGQTVLGAIDQGKNVDVYRFEASAGQRLTAEILARRLGSPLDAALALYDAAGNLLERDDDAGATGEPIVGGDALLTATIPGDGVYFLCVSDAQDSALSVHVYRLHVRLDDKK